MIIFTIIGVIVVLFIVIDWARQNSNNQRIIYKEKIVQVPIKEIQSEIFFVVVFDTKIKSEIERTPFQSLDDAERYFASSYYDIESPQYSFFLLKQLENSKLKIINLYNADPIIFQGVSDPYYDDFIKSQERKSRSIQYLTRLDYEKLLSITRKKLLDIYFNPDFFDEEKKASDEFEAFIISILIIAGVIKFNENSGDSYEKYILPSRSNEYENFKGAIIAESEFYMTNPIIKNKILNCLLNKNLEGHNSRVLFFLYLNSRIPLYSFPIDVILNSQEQDESYYEKVKMISNYHGRPFENFSPFEYPKGIPDNNSLFDNDIIISVMLVQEFFKYNR